MKTVLSSAGIDTKFRPHSTRAAANNASVPLDEILTTAHIYNKPAVRESHFASSVLETAEG